MKKALIITYVFKNREDIGSVRLHGLANYLPDYGWEPIILTTKVKTNDKFAFRVIETPFEDIYTKWKKMLGLSPNHTVKEQLNMPTLKNKKTYIDYLIQLWQEIFMYPDRGKGWYKYAIKAGNDLLEKEKFDAIISSSPPHISHLVANKLIKKTKIPWIADFRDLWTQDHYYPFSFLRKIFERRLEIRTLKSTSALVTISQPLIDMLKYLHKNKDAYLITNGFDPKYINPGKPLTRKFAINYTGALYQGKRDPEPLFRAIKDLSEFGQINLNDIEINFYGREERWLIYDVEKYDLKKVVKIHGEVSRDKSIEVQRESQVLLLLTWGENPAEKGVYTGKLFDYLAAQRPILSIGYNGGVLEELLNETGAGLHVSTLDELKNVILNFYYEYKKTGTVSYKGIDSVIDRYNHREMARNFASVLDKVCKFGEQKRFPRNSYSPDIC